MANFHSSGSPFYLKQLIELRNSDLYHKPYKMIVLADYQISAWDKALRNEGFKIIDAFQNNTGSKCYIYGQTKEKVPYVNR